MGWRNERLELCEERLLSAFSGGDKMNLQKHLRCILLILIIMGILLNFAGCRIESTPPEASAMEKVFQQHREDLAMVRDFLLSLGSASASIRSSDGKFFSNFEWKHIEDAKVVDAIEKLWGNGTSSIVLYQEWNSISFEMWYSHQDIGCGIVCSIDGIREPTLQFLTLLEPLSESGWYYYVEDYNQWRTNHNT